MYAYLRLRRSSSLAIDSLLLQLHVEEITSSDGGDVVSYVVNQPSIHLFSRRNSFVHPRLADTMSHIRACHAWVESFSDPKQVYVIRASPVYSPYLYTH